ncbi:rRNA-processing protein las1 [Apophysomyces sp. BC1015]|nr:rRNA-processing protein las1 [Apophysomyces sp. BC1015]
MRAVKSGDFARWRMLKDSGDFQPRKRSGKRVLGGRRALDEGRDDGSTCKRLRNPSDTKKAVRDQFSSLHLPNRSTSLSKMRLPRIVPWTGYQEFEQVYHWLYSDVVESPQLVELGIDRVKAWGSRGKVPRAVESTVTFAQIRLRDRMGLGGSWLSQQELRLMYAMAFVRFVNGMVDPEQDGAFAVSVAGIAERLGLPLWFVELRHAGTHEHLPSLAVLRDGSVQAMDWLHEFYWSQVLKPEENTILDAKAMENIKLLLSNYKEARKAFIKAHPAVSTKLASRIKNAAVGKLSASGMVPTGKKKRASPEIMSISDDLVQLWKPLIESFDDAFPGFGNDLITAMLERINTAANVDEELSKTLKPFLRYIDSLLSSTNNKKTPGSLSQIQDSDMSNELEELKKQLGEFKNKTRPTSSTMDEYLQPEKLSPWTMYDASSWTSCAIGCLPDGKMPTLDLTIDPLQPLP